MPTTPVYIICSPRPQVGKTLIARLLCEFQLLKNGDVVAFDINLKEPSLLEYLPSTTEIADIMDTSGKMRLMDRVIADDGIAKVIDLGFHAFDEFFKMSDEIGFMKEAVRRNVATPTASRCTGMRRCGTRFRTPI
jgi:Mrp family chromosome partitioning ATPase